MNSVVNRQHYISGEGLRKDELDSAYSWLENRNQNLVTMAAELEAKNENIFPRHFMKGPALQNIDPVSFWTCVGNRKVFSRSGCNIATKLMKLVASASGIERCFSTMGSIFGRNRNNLHVDKVSKLCTIYRSIRCLQDDE